MITSNLPSERSLRHRGADRAAARQTILDAAGGSTLSNLRAGWRRYGCCFPGWISSSWSAHRGIWRSSGTAGRSGCDPLYRGRSPADCDGAAGSGPAGIHTKDLEAVGDDGTDRSGVRLGWLGASRPPVSKSARFPRCSADRGQGSHGQNARTGSAGDGRTERDAGQCRRRRRRPMWLRLPNGSRSKIL